MKKAIFFIFIISLMLISCSKKQTECGLSRASLEGKWRMVLVKENHSGSMITKPSSIGGNVDITFVTNDQTSGTFFGNTPTNEISQSEYVAGTNQVLTITTLNMTKVAETSWGNEFVENIRSAQVYDFEVDGRLDIVTLSKTLVFKRLL